MYIFSNIMNSSININRNFEFFFSFVQFLNHGVKSFINFNQINHTYYQCLV